MWIQFIWLRRGSCEYSKNESSVSIKCWEFPEQRNSRRPPEIVPLCGVSRNNVGFDVWDCKQLRYMSSMRGAILWTRSLMVNDVAMKTGCVARHEADCKLLPHGATWSSLNLYLFHGETNLLSDKRIAIKAGHYNCDSTAGLLRTRSWQSRNPRPQLIASRDIHTQRKVSWALCVLRVRCLRSFVVNATEQCFSTAGP